jgi:hypothetical protein
LTFGWPRAEMQSARHWSAQMNNTFNLSGIAFRISQGESKSTKFGVYNK